MSFPNMTMTLRLQGIRTVVGLTTIAIGCTLPWVGTARADGDRQACYDAYEQAQIRKRDGDPRKARDLSRQCARDTCPSVVHADCLAWMEEAEKAIPTIVLQALTDEGDATAARVLVDEVEVATHLDGRSLEVDPGSHVIRFTMGSAQKEVHVVIKEGEKSRAVVADFRSPRPAIAQAAAAPKIRPVPSAVWIAAGVGAAGLLGFGAFAVAGSVAKSSLDNQCAPFCTEEQTSSSRSLFLAADVALGVGIVGAATATTLYLLRPEVEDSSNASPLQLRALRATPLVTPRMQGMSVSGSF